MNNNVPELRFPEFENSGKWVKKKLGEIINERKEKTKIENEYPVLSSGKNGLELRKNKFNREVSKSNKGYKIAYYLDIVYRPISEGKGFTNKFYFNIQKILDKGIVSSAYEVFKIKNNQEVSLYFLYYLLNNSENLKKEFSKNIQGSVRGELKFSTLKKLNVYIPPTLEEQEKIANFFSLIDKEINILEKKLENLKLYKKGLLEKFLNVKDNSEPELRFPEFKNSGKWVKKKLGDIAKIYQPKTISKNNFKKKGYPVYGANGKIGYYNEYNHEKWQVVIACRGSSCGIVNKTEDKSWITGNSMVINTENYENIFKLFLYYILQIQNFSRIIEGTGQSQITQKSLKSFVIYIPPTLEEQEKLANFFSLIDKEIDILEKKLENLKLYKKALLQKMLV